MVLVIDMNKISKFSSMLFVISVILCIALAVSVNKTAAVSDEKLSEGYSKGYDIGYREGVNDGIHEERAFASQLHESEISRIYADAFAEMEDAENDAYYAGWEDGYNEGYDEGFYDAEN